MRDSRITKAIALKCAAVTLVEVEPPGRERVRQSLGEEWLRAIPLAFCTDSYYTVFSNGFW